MRYVRFSFQALRSFGLAAVFSTALFAVDGFGACPGSTHPDLVCLAVSNTLDVTGPGGDCRKITNNCGADVLIPKRSPNEWSAFLANKPGCVALAACIQLFTETRNWGELANTCGNGSRDVNLNLNSEFPNMATAVSLESIDLRFDDFQGTRFFNGLTSDLNNTHNTGGGKGYATITSFSFGARTIHIHVAAWGWGKAAGCSPGKARNNVDNVQITVRYWK